MTSFVFTLSSSRNNSQLLVQILNPYQVLARQKKAGASITDWKTESQMDDNSTAPFLHQGTSVSQSKKSDLLTARRVVKPQGSTKAFREFSPTTRGKQTRLLSASPTSQHALLQTPCKQPSSWTQEPKPSEMHHPAASITGPMFCDTRCCQHSSANQEFLSAAMEVNTAEIL